MLCDRLFHTLKESAGTLVVCWRKVLAASQLFKSRTFFGAQFCWDVDIDMYELISRPTLINVGDTIAFHSKNATWLRTWFDR